MWRRFRREAPIYHWSHDRAVFRRPDVPTGVDHFVVRMTGWEKHLSTVVIGDVLNTRGSPEDAPSNDWLEAWGPILWSTPKQSKRG